MSDIVSVRSFHTRTTTYTNVRAPTQFEHNIITLSLVAHQMVCVKCHAFSTTFIHV